MAMVDLEPVPEEDDLLESEQHQGGDLDFKGKVDVKADMTRHDAERLRELVAQHLKWTGSPRAKAILDDWETWRPKFVKVMPIEYRKALEAMQAARVAAE
jgi:glutamate synthase (NADPH/NADH) large chain